VAEATDHPPVPLTRFTDAFERHDDVKVVLELGATAA
jgi:hypothetical protein